MAVGITVTIVICFLKCISAANMSGHVDGGQYSQIWQFPHSVYISIDCNNEVFGCGASILNQAIILSAAHCLNICSHPVVLTYSGNEHRNKGFMSPVSNIAIHEAFNDFYLLNDIALLRLQDELLFGRNVRRVIIMREPPYDENGFVAGWGRVKPGGPPSIYLKHISQRIYKREQCREIRIPHTPNGTICGEHWHKLGNPEHGDSGSALVVRNRHIQVGIVSYARLDISMTNTVYTDTGYFYDWIKENSEKLCCKEKTED